MINNLIIANSLPKYKATESHTMKKIKYFSMRTVLVALVILNHVAFSYAQTATLLPNGMQQFFDNNGNPLSSGTVDFYIPSTFTRKNTWQDSAETIVNNNPVILDGSGRALIYGDGIYRQILKDSGANLIWDKQVSSFATGSTIITTGDGDVVGTVKPFAGIVAPSQYQFAAGQEISRTTFSALFTAITLTTTVSCVSGNTTVTGVPDISSIPVGGNVELTCVPAGTTVVSKSGTSVTLSNPSNVSLNASAIFFMYGNGNGSTTFNIPDLRGYVIAANDNMGSSIKGTLTSTFFGTNPDAIGAKGGSQSTTLAINNIPSHNHTNNVIDPGHSHFFSPTHSATRLIVQNAGGADITSGGNTAETNTSVQTATTGITVTNNSNGGSGLALTATLINGGSGYTNGAQVLTISGGTCSVQPSFNVTVAGNIVTSINSVANAGNCSIPPGNPVATTGGGGTNATLNAIFTAQPFGTIQPTFTLNYIIKVTPDTSSQQASGVASLGGQTGVIGCGTGLLCTGNSISANLSFSNLSGTLASGQFGPLTGDVTTSGYASTISTTLAPTIPIIAPSSPGAPSATGSGCNPTASSGAVLHNLLYTDQNWCTLFNLWSMSSIEPSALMTLTVSGTFTNGDLITLTFFQQRGSTITSSVTYTVQGGDTAATVAAALTTAIKANSVLYTSPSGGYGSNAIFSYVPASGTNQVFADFDARWQTSWQYTVSAASTEIITASAGWLTTGFYTGGTTGGAANAQTITIGGFTDNTGVTVQVAAGFSNSAAATLNVNSGGALNIQKYVQGVLTNVATGDILSGSTYAFNHNAICNCWVIGQSSTPVIAFATKGSQSILPNAWDATFIVQPSRVTGTNSVLPQLSGAAPPGSSLWFLSPACQTTDFHGTLYGNITCAQFGLVSAGLAHGNVQGDWMMQTTQGGLFMFGAGMFYPAGCSYLFQPGCGLVDKGVGTINFTNYYRNNIQTSTITTQTFLSGTNATYTTPTGVSAIEVEIVGAGGGGAGSGTTPGAATSGGNTCWNTSGTACTSPVFQAGGGALGTTNITSSTGGVVSGSGTCNDSQPGGAGGVGPAASSAFGGIGGSSRYGGAGAPGWGGANNANPGATNSGSGGGGAGENATNNGGGGGAAGAWCYFVITNPAATYVYTIGTAGTAGTAGTGGNAGAGGAAGKLRVIERYN